MRDEDSIEELTLILAADSANLLGLGAAQREGLVVDTVEDDLTLDVGGEFAGGATSHLDDLVLLATQEVLHDKLVTGLGADDVDGEMSVDQSHFVAEALSTMESRAR